MYICMFLHVHVHVRKLHTLLLNLSVQSYVHVEISSSLIITAMHDRVSVNWGSHVHTLDSVQLYVRCFLHTLDHVGERMNTPVLYKSIKIIDWNVHSQSKTRLALRAQTGLPQPTHSVTRWWSKFEVIHEVCDSFGDVVR